MYRERGKANRGTAREESVEGGPEANHSPRQALKLKRLRNDVGEESVPHGEAPYQQDRRPGGRSPVRPCWTPMAPTNSGGEVVGLSKAPPRSDALGI